MGWWQDYLRRRREGRDVLGGVNYEPLEAEGEIPPRLPKGERSRSRGWQKWTPPGEDRRCRAVVSDRKGNKWACRRYSVRGTGYCGHHQRYAEQTGAGTPEPQEPTGPQEAPDRS